MTIGLCDCERDDDICARHGNNCGTVSDFDACTGHTRQATCSACGGSRTCSAGRCTPDCSNANYTRDGTGALGDASALTVNQVSVQDAIVALTTDERTIITWRDSTSSFYLSDRRSLGNDFPTPQEITNQLANGTFSTSISSAADHRLAVTGDGLTLIGGPQDANASTFYCLVTYQRADRNNGASVFTHASGGPFANLCGESAGDVVADPVLSGDGLSLFFHEVHAGSPRTLEVQRASATVAFTLPPTHTALVQNFGGDRAITAVNYDATFALLSGAGYTTEVWSRANRGSSTWTLSWTTAAPAPSAWGVPNMAFFRATFGTGCNRLYGTSTQANATYEDIWLITQP